MIIGCVKEVLNGEGRVAILPQDVRALTEKDHEVLIEASAGKKSGFKDREYKAFGATTGTHEDVWRGSDLVVKVKQPTKPELRFLYSKQGLILSCFLHLASPENSLLLEALQKSGTTAIDYGTIQRDDESTHILAEMSKIAGRIAFFDGAKLLMRHKKIMIGPSSTVAILGLGNAGAATAELVAKANPKMLYLFDKNPEKFKPLRRFYQQLSLHSLWFVQHDRENPSHEQALASILEHTDLLIGAAHIPGERQVKLVPEWMVENMQPGSVVMDISIDQGGCFETSRATSLRKQTFQKHGVAHYCVPNMPGMTPRESTPALTRETFPYIRELAEKGFENAVLENPALAKGVNIHKGWITHEGLADSIGRMKDYKPLSELL
jgi:alanine dehydrogenase